MSVQSLLNVTYFRIKCGHGTTSSLIFSFAKKNIFLFYIFRFTFALKYVTR